MRLFRTLSLRFRSLFDRSRVETDLEDELRDYLDREAEQAIAAGSTPEEARRLALASLNGMERMKEECRDARGVRWLEETLSDFRYAVRTLRRTPVFTITVITALAFCIGVNTAIFSIVDTALFRPLPFPDQEHLVSVTEGVPGLGFPVLPFSPPDYLFVAAHNQSFAATGSYRTRRYELSGVGQPLNVKGARLTASLFQVLGISPAIGRTFTQEEDEHSKRVAVLSDAFAQSAFGTAEKAMGRTILLDRTSYTVIGVMPRSFTFPIYGSRFNGNPADVFIPVSWSNDDRKQTISNFDFSMVARLKPNVTLQQANAEMSSLLKRIVEDYPPSIKQSILQRLPNFSLESKAVPFREEFTGDARRPLLLLLAAVGIVLLIGCADVANLMFSRMVGHQKEFVLRAALGAGRWRLTRQTLAEGLVLSVAGGAIGVCLAFWALPLLLRFAPENLPRLNEISLNWRMLVFVSVVTLATPLFFCLGPLANTIRSAFMTQLRGEGRTATQGKHQRFIMSAAVVTQFSLAFLLLTTAGLLTRSLIKATEANPGFRPEHTITAQIALPDSSYQTRREVDSLFNRLLERINALPGVREAGAISDLPMGSTSNVIISLDGHGADNNEKVDFIFCRGNTLDALRVPLLRGRLLQPEDEVGQPHSVVISETLAKRISPRGDAIGRRLRIGADIPGNGEPWLTVVGIVGDVRSRMTDNSPGCLCFRHRETG